MCFTKRDVFRHFLSEEELEQEKTVAKVPPPCFPSGSSGRVPDRRFVSSSQRGSWRKSLSAPPRKNGSARPSRRKTQPRRRMTSPRSRDRRSLCSDLGVRSSRSPNLRCVHPTRCRAAFLCPGADSDLGLLRFPRRAERKGEPGVRHRHTRLHSTAHDWGHRHRDRGNRRGLSPAGPSYRYQLPGFRRLSSRQRRSPTGPKR